MFLEKHPLYVNVANGGTMYEKQVNAITSLLNQHVTEKITRAIAGIKHFTQVLSTIFEYNLRKKTQ